MGMTDITMTVANLQNPQKRTAVRFLVDSGASYSSIPASIPKKLGLKPSFEQTFSLADGSMMKRKIGNAMVSWQGKEIATPVILGQGKDTALLGALTLEGLGLVLDPLRREIRPANLRM